MQKLRGLKAMREPERVAVSGVREREQGRKERREVEAVVLEDHVDRETDKQESQMKRGLLRLAETAMATRQSVGMVVLSVPLAVLSISRLERDFRRQP
jgi:hypothetical protein